MTWRDDPARRPYGERSSSTGKRAPRLGKVYVGQQVRAIGSTSHDVRRPLTSGDDDE